jgi:hypothetical protein
MWVCHDRERDPGEDIGKSTGAHLVLTRNVDSRPKVDLARGLLGSDRLMDWIVTGVCCCCRPGPQLAASMARMGVHSSSTMARGAARATAWAVVVACALGATADAAGSERGKPTSGKGVVAAADYQGASVKPVAARGPFGPSRIRAPVASFMEALGSVGMSAAGTLLCLLPPGAHAWYQEKRQRFEDWFRAKLLGLRDQGLVSEEGVAQAVKVLRDPRTLVVGRDGVIRLGPEAARRLVREVGWLGGGVADDYRHVSAVVGAR